MLNFFRQRKLNCKRINVLYRNSRAMADKEIKIHKKIVWKLDMTKEKFEAYKYGETLESASTKIVMGDNITEWFLRIYPGGLNQYVETDIALFLMLREAASKSVKAKFTLEIVGKNENVDWKTEKPGESFKNGYGSFLLKRADFLNPDLGYYNGSQLTIHCKLTLVANEVPKSNKAVALTPCRRHAYFEKLVDDEHFVDFEIETTEANYEKKVLKAHKCVLAYGSPIFYGMLTADMKESRSNVVKVPEDSIVMKEVLRFIYTGDDAENLS